jgi:hypothetical protein
LVVGAFNSARRTHIAHTEQLVVAGLTLVLEYAVGLTEGEDNNSRSKVLLQVGEELVDSGARA